MAFLCSVKRLFNGSQLNSVRLCSTSTAPKLYITGLPRTASVKKLRRLFSEFGKIVEAKVEINEAMGKEYVLGSVTFSEIEEAEVARKAVSGRIIHFPYFLKQW